MLNNRVPVGDLIHGGLYLIRSRNLSIGVYNAISNGYIGIRSKFLDKYLFTEYDWEIGPPFGTVTPIEFLCECPHEPKDDNKVLFKWLEEMRAIYKEKILQT